MRIASRSISPHDMPYIIAEIGVNHDGSLDRALSLIDVAREAQADAVKFQYFEAERLLSSEARLADYQHAQGERDPVEMLRRLELTSEQFAEVVAHAHSVGLHAIVTVFSLEHCDSACALPWDAFKVASPDAVNGPLLKRIRADGRPMIVSTGAASRDEIAYLARTGCCDAVLHCVSAYPTPMANAQLGGIIALAELIQHEHPKVMAGDSVPVGYSDHTAEIDTGALAVCAGASILEKHITDDCKRAGPDHTASLEPVALNEYVHRARQAHEAIGVRDIVVQDVEFDVRMKSRQSIVAAKQISKGEIITFSHLTLKRPGTGIAPRCMDQVIGSRATRTLNADTLIHSTDLDPPLAMVNADTCDESPATTRS